MADDLEQRVTMLELEFRAIHIALEHFLDNRTLRAFYNDVAVLKEAENGNNRRL